MPRTRIEVYANDTWTHKATTPMRLLPDQVFVYAGVVEIVGSPAALHHLADAIRQAAEHGDQVFASADRDGTRGS